MYLTEECTNIFNLQFISVCKMNAFTFIIYNVKIWMYSWTHSYECIHSKLLITQNHLYNSSSWVYSNIPIPLHIYSFNLSLLYNLCSTTPLLLIAALYCTLNSRLDCFFPKIGRHYFLGISFLKVINLYSSFFFHQWPYLKTMFTCFTAVKLF